MIPWSYGRLFLPFSMQLYDQAEICSFLGEMKSSPFICLCRTRGHPSLWAGGMEGRAGKLHSYEAVTGTDWSESLRGLLKVSHGQKGDKSPSGSGKLTAESSTWIFCLRFRKELPSERCWYVFELICPTKNAWLEGRFQISFVFYP